MKRLLTIGLMLAAALALTNCVDQFETPVQENDIIVDETTTLQGEGEPFEVFVETAETKLNYDGNTYSWNDGKNDSGESDGTEADQISLYSLIKNSNNTQSLQYHSNFKYIGGGKFVGKLASALQDVNDWYSLFPCSSSAPTITIGATSTQKQLSANNKRHLVGAGYPMYGVKKNVPKNKSPKFSMSHLSAIIALEIVNNGAGGNIVIKDAQIEATEEIVGDFTVDLLGASGPTFTKGNNVSKIARVELTNAATVTYGNSATLYLAVKPFDASNKDLKINVNGSTRTVKMPANTVFTAGTVTKLRVPIEAPSRTGVSDAFNLTSEGSVVAAVDTPDAGTHKVGTDGKIITTTNCAPYTFTVNGQTVNGYKLGTPKTAQSDGSTGTITITGFFKDLLAALPVNFYVAGWDNTPAQMSVNNIKIWIPHYSSETDTKTATGKKEKVEKKWVVFEVYYERTDVITKTSTHTYSLNKRANHSMAAMAGDLLGGEECFKMDTDLLLTFAKKLNEFIPFNGILPQGYHANSNIIMMDEEVAQKSINKDNMEKFLTMFGASFDGLKELVEIEEEELPVSVNVKQVTTKKYVKDARNLSKDDILGGIFDILGEEVKEISTVVTTEGWPGDLGVKYPAMVSTIEAMSRLLSNKTLVNIETANLRIEVHDLISTDPYSLIRLLRDAKISVELGTTAEGPCVVFWGLDANVPETVSDSQGN